MTGSMSHHTLRTPCLPVAAGYPHADCRNLVSAAAALCREGRMQAELQQQLPDILQQLQHSGDAPTAFLLALRAEQVSLRAEQAEAELAVARQELRQARCGTAAVD